MKLHNIASTTNILILLAALLSINFISSKYSTKIDLTSGRLYTLSDGSKNIVRAIDDEATIKYFYSASNEELPVMVKNYATRVEELLREFADYSSELNVEVYDPRPDSDEEEMAVKYGISSAQVGSSEPFYMGAAVQYRDKTYQIPFFDPRKESFLEYDIASMLTKLKESGGKKTLGILAGFPVSTPKLPPQMRMQMPQQNEDWLFVQELEKTFVINDLPSDTEEVPSEIDLLLVLHPKGFSDKTEYAIEQYILRGGKTVLIVDPSAQSIHEQNNQLAQYGMQQSTSSDLKSIFQMLGLEYDVGKVVVDQEHATRVGTDGGTVQYPFWLSLDQPTFNADMVATGQLTSALFVESGYFDPRQNSEHTYTSLITSGAKSGTIDARQLMFLNPRSFDNYTKDDKPFSLAGVVTGTFNSVFGKKPEDSKYSDTHIERASVKNSVLVIGDVDFLNNRYALKKLSFLGMSMLQPINQNITLLLNALEFAGGNSELISIRSRGSFSRPFHRVKEIEIKAQQKWFSVEKELTDKIQQLQQKLNALHQAKTSDNQLMLTREQQDEIDKFKLEQLEVKRKRRNVRKNLRQDIERLGTFLTVLNISLVPLIVLCTGLFIYIRRTQGRPLI